MTGMETIERPSGSPEAHRTRGWWRDAVVYQVYVRSFADGNGDGVGDLAGVRERLPYLRELGIDALWFNPWYPSPLADNGYDIVDYRDVDPLFGSLSDADDLLARAHELGLRVVVDLVPNHTSDCKLQEPNENSQVSYFLRCFCARTGCQRRRLRWRARRSERSQSSRGR